MFVTRLSSLLLLLSIPLTVLSATVPALERRDAVAASTVSGTCSSIQKRQEWRSLTNAQKTAYLNAVVCLQKLPNVTSFKGSKTRFDDFQALHVDNTLGIHSTGQFFAWHRRYVQLYETTLREKCGYTGAQPYWDWSIDVDATGSIVNAPVFDATYGFGGNGAYIAGWAGPFGNMTNLPGTGGGCITDGPFKGLTLHIGPGTSVTDHCLVRAINDNVSFTMTGALVSSALAQTTYEAFRLAAGGTFRADLDVDATGPPTFVMHDGGHGGVHGEMANVFSSPGDPLFFLHHANLDRIWWNWQAKSLSTRLTEISGPTTYQGSTQVTLAWNLVMGALGSTLPIKSVMDVRAYPMCYNYV